MRIVKHLANRFRKNLLLPLFLVSLLLLSSSSCGGDEGIETPTSDELVGVDELSLDLTNDWFVEITGDDGNSCRTIDEPCLTIVAALRKSHHGDRIHVGDGTFMDFSDYGSVLRVIHNISIIGAGPGVTIIDGGNERGGIDVGIFGGSTDVSIEGLTIQNTGRGPASGCIGITGGADVTVQNVELRNCWRSGVSHTGSGVVSLIDVFIHHAVDENPDPEFTLNGTGVETSGEMIIEGGEIANNPRNGMEISGGPVTVIGTLVNDNLLRGILVSRSGVASLSGVNVTNNGERGFGTGLYVDGGRLNVSGSDIYSNAGGGVYVRNGILRMDTSTLRDEAGFALRVAPAGSAILDELIITNNGRSGPAFNPTVSNSGNLTISRSTITGNFRTALYNQETGQATIVDTDISSNLGGYAALVNLETAQMEIARTLISNNRTGEQAAFESFGMLSAINLTVSNNSGLGIRARAPFSFSYSTIAENGQDGILFDRRGGIFSDNLIVKNDRADCTFPGIDMILNGTNIDSDGSCDFPETYSPAALRLGPLTDNGGLTSTHALEPASPAVDAASSLTCPTRDQRSFARPPRPNCDVGAYEISRTMIALEAIEFEEEESKEFNTPTPVGPPTVLITTDTLCLSGPSPSDYEVINTLTQETVGELIGAGETGAGNDDWVVMSHPNFPDIDCWVEAVYALPSIPFSEMRLIFKPPMSTATPKETREPSPDSTDVAPAPTCDPQQGQC